MATVTIAESQSIVNGTALTLVERQVTPAAEFTLTLATGVGSLSGHTFTIVGQDANGAAQTATLGSLALGANTTTETWLSVLSVTPNGVFTGYTVSGTYDGDVPVGFNCDCDDDNPNETLEELRLRLLRRLGYAAQAANPPPGMADLLNDFLLSAHRLMYRRYAALRMERIFTWIMEVGGRYYDLDANVEVCTKRLDSLKISGAWVEDLNGAWMPLVARIPPEFYTMVEYQGIPARYEVRQCIEVFPAPAEPYKLRIKGFYGPEAFTEDDDKPSIDSELVFLWALGNAKLHYGQPDASQVAEQANMYLAKLIAGTHTTQRYIPGPPEPPPLSPPIYLPLVTP